MFGTVTRNEFWPWRTLMIAATVAVTGCGRAVPAGKYTVSGEITCGGEPVAEGHIAFVPLDGSLVPDGAFFKDGKYSLLAKPGEKRVEIRASRQTEIPDPGFTANKRESIIAPQYNSESRLTAVVEPNNDNRFDFHLDAIGAQK